MMSEWKGYALILIGGVVLFFLKMRIKRFLIPRGVAYVTAELGLAAVPPRPRSVATLSGQLEGVDVTVTWLGSYGGQTQTEIRLRPRPPIRDVRAARARFGDLRLLYPTKITLDGDEVVIYSRMGIGTETRATSACRLIRAMARRARAPEDL
jgi:hypothetical protein